jgi:hypothetical protein
VSDLDPLRLIEPKCYAQYGYPHEAWTRLRRDAFYRYNQSLQRFFNGAARVATRYAQ